MSEILGLARKLRVGIVYFVSYILVSYVSIVIFIRLGFKFAHFNWSVSPTLSLFVYVVIFAPFLEEIVFRFVPIKLTGSFTESKFILWTVIVSVSVVFGYLHGAWPNVFIQGIAGILFSRAFLKGGLTSSFTAHMLTNLFVFISIYRI